MTVVDTADAAEHAVGTLPMELFVRLGDAGALFPLGTFDLDVHLAVQVDLRTAELLAAAEPVDDLRPQLAAALRDLADLLQTTRVPGDPAPQDDP